MKAIFFPGDRRAQVSDIPVPATPAGYVRVRMVATGICGTDLHRFRYDVETRKPEAGFVTGHEAVGVVDEVGEGVDPAIVGSKVVVWHIWGCGAPDGPCADAQASDGKWCPHGAVMGATAHGANSEWQVVPARCAMPLPDRFTAEDGVVLACSYGTAWRAVRTGRVRKGLRVGIWGLGPVGLCAVQASLLLGAEVVAVDVIPDRRAFAEKLGAAAIDPSHLPAARRGEDLFDVTIDTTGRSDVQATLLSVTRHGGYVVLVGAGPHTGIDRTNAITLKELHVAGSLVYDRDEWDALLAFVDEHHADLGALVSHRFEVNQHDVDEAYKVADLGQSSKIVLSWRDQW